MGRWAIHIDERFGTLYDHHNDVLLALSALMEGVHRIGTAVFPDSPDRLSLPTRSETVSSSSVSMQRKRSTFPWRSPSSF
jgi:hypothetical protein